MRRICLGHYVVQWVAKQTNEHGGFDSPNGIGLQQWDGQYWRMIAGVVYCQHNGPNVVCHIASDGSKMWMTREYLRVIFDYPFNQQKVNRITVCVGEGNKESRTLVEHFGFVQEANLKGAHPSGDLIVYRLWKEDCRFIKPEFVRRVSRDEPKTLAA